MADNTEVTGKGKAVKEKSAFREYTEAILIAAVLALFIRTFVIQAFKIPSGSMEPTLQIGDHILVNKFLFGTKIPFADIKVLPIRPPRRGDIVVFKFPENESKDFIKRVVGTPGDVVQVIDKKVFVNGKPITEPYAVYKDENIIPRELQARDNYGPVTVPAGKIFVMGDNRDRSYDSRFWGFVDYVKVEGKALVIYWSWDGDGSWARWGRIGHVVK